MVRAKLGLIIAAFGCIVAHSGIGACLWGEDAVKKQVMELRTYELKDELAVEAFDKYAAEALLPALNRLGIQPVGAFAPLPGPSRPPGADNAPPPPAPSWSVMLLLPAKDAETIVTANDRIAKDEAYRAAAASYLQTPSDKPLIGRIDSELLVAFDSWPQVKIPKQKTADRSRIYELRTYESPSEQLGHLKVEMFNSGEVPIFLDCDIQPVFMGQAVIGKRMPNLSYMTVYNDAAEMAAAWKRFSDHPEWHKLRDVKKYTGTVSKIHKSNWTAKPYSQL